jgi:SAM-dependent methyltransferase
MKKDQCVLCGSNHLFEFLDLGYSPHSDQFRDNKTEAELWYPLALVQCQDCELVQLSYIVPRKDLFTKDYLYESSITKTANVHWKEFTQSVIKNTGINKGLIVDIGGNDGTLLQEFKAKGFNVVNVDPCKDVTDIAENNGIPSITEFWRKGLVKGADIILGTNVFAHTDDYNGFIEGVVDSLKEDGVFIFESPYFGEFIKGLEYDTVYHQHVTYISLKPTIRFLEKVGMEIFNIEFTPLHGGSFRCYIARKGKRKIQPIVQESIDKEDFSKEILIDFANKVKEHRNELMNLLWKIKSEGKTIGVVSAPAKGMTLMNYCGIKDNLVDFITERSTLKQGRYAPGSHIVINPDSLIELVQPDYLLLLAWNFADEIIANNKNFKGKWIVPLPNIQIK